MVALSNSFLTDFEAVLVVVLPNITQGLKLLVAFYEIQARERLIDCFLQ